jgi:hypothetical protein
VTTDAVCRSRVVQTGILKSGNVPEQANLFSVVRLLEEASGVLQKLRIVVLPAKPWQEKIAELVEVSAQNCKRLEIVGRAVNFQQFIFEF